MKIYLIRHGKTAANERRLYCGRTDLPLSEEGVRELNGVRCDIPDAPRFITSGMRRCRETMALLFGEVKQEIVPALREIDFGIFEMRSYEALKDDPAYQAWITGDNERNVPPKGESGLHMRRRVRNAFSAIVAEGRDAVIVTHGGVIAAIMSDLFPAEARSRYDWQPAPGRGYLIEIEPETGRFTYTALNGKEKRP